MTMRQSASARSAAILMAAALCASLAAAEDIVAPLLLAGEEAEVDELGLWELVERQRYVKAREDTPSQPWRWHARILVALTRAHGDLEHYDEQLGFMYRYNELYTPQLKAELAWPLMKKREFDKARLAAEEGLATGDPYQIERAKNALCAIEFEAGDDAKSYEVCAEAVEYGTSHFGSATAVDLGNYAEAARSVFRFDEAERLLMEASKSGLSWYGNPWIARPGRRTCVTPIATKPVAPSPRFCC
jgi:hypothetical protein